MNSPQQPHEVHLRGLEDVGCGEGVVHVAGSGEEGGRTAGLSAAPRAWIPQAVEALFASRLGARQGLPLSQRRVYPLRTGLEPFSIGFVVSHPYGHSEGAPPPGSESRAMPAARPKNLVATRHDLARAPAVELSAREGSRTPATRFFGRRLPVTGRIEPAPTSERQYGRGKALQTRPETALAGSTRPVARSIASLLG